SLQMTSLEEMLRDVAVSQIMQRNPVSVPEQLPLDRLGEDFFYRYRFTSFPVERNAELVGLVHINQVKEVPRTDWPLRVVGEVMSPRATVVVVAPEESAIEAFRQMSQTGASKLPVAADGRLVGIVTARDILRLFRIKSDLVN
ncbi:MAG TPA: CBS domain-containing protein, partial [Candidatus Acidoferrales bacterium]